MNRTPGWRQPLFDICYDISIFFKAWFCPCVVCGELGQELYSLDHKSGMCAVCCVTTATCLTSLIVFRGNLRQKRGIPGSLVTDAGAMCLCCPCAWVQIAAEVAPPDIAGAPVESGDIKE